MRVGVARAGGAVLSRGRGRTGEGRTGGELTGGAPPVGGAPAEQVRVGGARRGAHGLVHPGEALDQGQVFEHVPLIRTATWPCAAIGLETHVRSGPIHEDRMQTDAGRHPAQLVTDRLEQPGLLAQILGHVGDRQRARSLVDPATDDDPPPGLRGLDHRAGTQREAAEATEREHPIRSKQPRRYDPKRDGMLGAQRRVIDPRLDPILATARSGRRRTEVMWPRGGSRRHSSGSCTGSQPWKPGGS